MSETTVVLGVGEESLQEEVLHFLDRTPRLRVVGAAADGATLARRVEEARPDAAVVSPDVLRSAPDLDGAALFVVAERETTEALRAAIRASASGFFLWPEEREALVADAGRARRVPSPDGSATARVVAILGARGGAGATFVATHLAALCATEGATVVLVDADPFFSDVGAALGVTNGASTMTDLSPVADELAWEHLDRVLYQHPRGFRVLLAPSDGAEAALPTDRLRDVVDALRSRVDVVVLHLPRSVEIAVPAIEAADELLLLVTLDVLAFRDARRLISLLEARGLERRCGIVVNRASPSEVIPEDVERVFGLPPLAVIPIDRAVPRAQNRGELLAGAGPAVRRLQALAAHVLRGREA